MKTSAALAVAAIGVLFGTYGWMRGSRAPLRGVTLGPEVAAPSGKQVVVHEHRYVGLTPSQAAAAQTKEAAPADPETIQAAERRSIDTAEHRFRIESAYDDDPPPTVASRKLEGTILKGFASPVGKGATVTSLECKATRCRLEVTFDNREKDRDVIRNVFMRSTELDLAGTVVERKTDPDGRVHAVIYLKPTTSTPDAP